MYNRPAFLASVLALGAVCIAVRAAEAADPPFVMPGEASAPDLPVEGDILDLGIADKIVDKSGSWLSYGETRLGQGRENARAFLRENRDVREEILGKIMEAAGVAKPEPAAVG